MSNKNFLCKYILLMNSPVSYRFHFIGYEDSVYELRNEFMGGKYFIWFRNKIYLHEERREL